MAARGGSIDQLMSNLGRHYAGGGIIAFSEGNEVKDPDKDKRSALERFFYSNITPAEQRRMAMLQAIAAAKEGSDQQKAAPEPAPEPVAEQQAFLTPQQMEANVKEGPLRQVTQRELAESFIRKRAAQKAEDAAAPKESYGAKLEKFLYSNITPAEQRRREALQAAANERAGIKPMDAFPDRSNRAILNAADAGLRSQPGASDRALLNAADAGLRSQPMESAPAQVKPAAPRPSADGPSAGGPSVGGPATPAAALDPNSLRALIEANIRKELGKDESAEWAKGAKRYEDFMGIDKLLQPREARIAERQEMIRRLQGERTPAWVEALSAAGTPIRGGVGSLINMMGNKAQATRAGYSAEDLKFFDEIGAMQDEVAKLKLEGKYKAAAAGEAAIKDVIANKRQSESSGASLVATDERAEASKQIAADNRAARALTAAGQAQTAALAREEKIRQFNETELRKMREKEIDRAAKIEAAIAKRTGNIDVLLQKSKFKPGEEAELLRRRNEIVKQVKAEYPSARPEKPSESQFLAAARAVNPGVSDADLKAYYKQNYGS